MISSTTFLLLQLNVLTYITTDISIQLLQINIHNDYYFLSKYKFAEVSKEDIVEVQFSIIKMTVLLFMED